MEKLELAASSRTELGKKTKALRAAGKVPAVVYGHGTPSQAVTLDRREAEKIYAQAGSNRILTVTMAEGGSKNALFYDVSVDARNGSMVHADLYTVRMDEAIQTEVPLHFTGESTAVYQENGTLVKNKELVEVEALPAELPELIEVDISILDDFEKSIHVRDLVLPKGVTILDDEDELVVKVEAPRTDEEIAALDEEVVAELPEGVADEDQVAVAEENEGGADK